jgi:excisionase family DNA binding protein
MSSSLTRHQRVVGLSTTDREVLTVSELAEMHSRCRPPASTPEVMTAQDLASYLQIGKNKAYELLATGQMPFVNIGKRGIRVQRRVVDEWLDRGAGSLTPLSESGRVSTSHPQRRFTDD